MVAHYLGVVGVAGSNPVVPIFFCLYLSKTFGFKLNIIYVHFNNKNMVAKIFKFILGMIIILLIYYVSFIILKVTQIKLPPTILGLVLFAWGLSAGVIKEEWVNVTVNFMLKNMPVLFIPFIVGIVLYKSILAENIIAICLTVLVSTTLTIVGTGLFVEYGIKLLRLYKMKKQKGNNDD